MDALDRTRITAVRDGLALCGAVITSTLPGYAFMLKLGAGAALLWLRKSR